MSHKKFLSVFIVLLFASSLMATPVKVKMNGISTTMSLTNSTTHEVVNVGAVSGSTYKFSAAPGTYTLTGYATDGTTVNGTIDLDVTESSDTLSFQLFTITANATNSGWVYGTDYTIVFDVASREGKVFNTTLGNAVSSSNKTFLVFIGNSYHLQYIPSDARKKEGYMTCYKSATITNNASAAGTITLGYPFAVTVPNDATCEIGIKISHYVKFTQMPIDSIKENGNSKLYYYTLAASQVYNYRISAPGKLTHAGYFTMKSDAAACPSLVITEQDMMARDPQFIDHEVTSNANYNVGDIFLNINERGHLKLDHIGDSVDLLPMRTWQLTDNSTNNYFMEPDFHFRVINANGVEDNSVVKIENEKLTAVGNGTAIVLVTYDAIACHYFSGTAKTSYMGGAYWGAIWPENTGVFVVTVGGNSTSIDSKMLINEAYNDGAKKLAGSYVDAEHDVFYYLDTDDHYDYTFTPEGVFSVEIAYPTIGEHAATYTHFSTEGVVYNNVKSSYTVSLKRGRNIVRLTDNSGTSVYQVLTCKPTHRVITVAGRGETDIFQPGDEVKIQYSGLFHPANKLSGIYNMSAYVTYNGTPNGESLILGSGQYTFASVPAAQAVSFTIPADIDVDANPTYIMNEGVIQVNGYGDPIGNHRNTSKVTGRNPNFSAIAHKTYFGSIPDIVFTLRKVKTFYMKITSNVTPSIITIKDYKGNALTEDANGFYSGSYSNYDYLVKSPGYNVNRGTISITTDSPDTIYLNLTMTPTPENGWDGMSYTEPEKVTAAESNTTGGQFEGLEDYYKIRSGAHLAWFAKTVNAGSYTISAALAGDVDLCNADWAPIGGTTATKAFKGVVDGTNHAIDGLYISATTTYNGLFGYISAATVRNLTVRGQVTSTGNYSSGIVAYAASSSTISNCHNEVVVNGKGYVGGVVGYATASTITQCSNIANLTATGNYIGGITSNITPATASLTNCYNWGDITSTSNYVGGITGGPGNNSTAISNCYNYGAVKGNGIYVGAIKGHTTYGAISNVYAPVAYLSDTKTAIESNESFANGKVAWALGAPFGQTIGTDALPIFSDAKVYRVIYTNSLNSDVDTLYTNGTLPSIFIEGEMGQWFTSKEGDEVYSITADAALYLNIDLHTALDVVNSNKITIFAAQHMLHVSLPEASALSIYNVLGQKVWNSNEVNTCTIHLPQTGVYIVKAGNEVVKVVIR